MPTRPLGPCRVPSCPNRATRFGRCEQHRNYGRERPSPTARGYGAEWVAVRDEYLQYHAVCSCADEAAIETHRKWGNQATTVHHKRPKLLGGTDDWDNLEALCTRCHTRLHKTTARDL